MFCKHCGNQVEDGAYICVKCGTKIGDGHEHCAHCGNNVPENAEYCTACGFSLKNPAQTNVKTNTQNDGLRKGLYLAAFILMIIAAVSCLISAFAFMLYFVIALIATIEYEGLFFMVAMAACMLTSLIPLCWTIPMIVHLGKKRKRDEPVSIAFKVCSLIFISPVVGILLLCCTSDYNK